MGSMKDRNGMDLTEAEDVKKRWQEYTEKLYKKDLHDPGNHNGVITHLEPDILECEVKWALESITINKVVDVGNLISGSSAFSKTSLNIWKFTVHVLLKPVLEKPVKSYFTSMRDECNCVVV